MEVADALGEQKKQLFGNPLYTVKEMITNGDLFIADIHFDAVYEEEFDRSDDDEGKSEYSYYVQFSTPELARATETARRRLVSMTGWRSC